MGDLVSAAAVFGVAHPPGYPLFTLLGFLLTKLPLGLTPAFMVGLISSFSAALGVAIFYLLILRLTKNILVSAISTFILAFSYLYWFYAEIAEVFALNNFFAILLFYLAILFRQTAKVKYLYLFFITLGLSLTNHHTIIFIFPSLFILIFVNLIKLIKKKPKTLIFCLLSFFLGFSVYLYVPIASSRNPVINWDNVKDFPSFWRLLLRKDYGTFSAGLFLQPTLLQRLIILKTYFLYLFSQLTIPVMFLSLIGAVVLYFRDRLLFVSLVLAFIISGPLFIGYAGFPLMGTFFIGVYERFFVLSSIFLIFFFPFGLMFVTRDFLGRFLRRKFLFLFQAVFILIPLLLFYYNFPKTDLHNVAIGDNLGLDFLSPLPNNSVLILSGDTALFNAWYAHYGLKFRSDVELVNLNGMAGDKYLGAQMDMFKKKNPKVSDEEVVIAATKEISKIRPVFSYDQIQPSKGEKLVWLPSGLSFKLVTNKSDLPSKEEFLAKEKKIWQTLHVPDSTSNKLAFGSLSISDIPSIYANALLAAGNFVISEYNDQQEALSFYLNAQKTDPHFAKTYKILGIYYLTLQKSCSEARLSLTKAIELDRFDKLSYFLLYSTYKDCLKDEVPADKIAADYKKVFLIDFFEDLAKSLKKDK